MRRYAALYLGLCHAWGWSDTKSWRDTCALCGALDGKVFGMPGYQEGLTAPPFHPWCCTCPCFEDMEKLGERWARSPDGTTGRVPADMSFEEWKRQLVQGTPRSKDVLTEYIQKAMPGQGLITYDAACNASQIKMFEVDSFGKFVVQLIDSSRPDACYPGKLSLCPANFAKFPGQ